MKEVLTKLLQEMLPNGDKVFHEIHDENKRNVNHDFRDSKFRKFYGKDLLTWILQMEQFFDLHDVSQTQKVRITSFYLEKN